MQRVLHIAGLLAIIILALACAKQSNAGPTGGPKDETPPRVIESDPPDKTTNFRSKEFVITFDEYFILDNVSQKLMVSPPFDKKPVIKTKGKSMVVSFEEELRDSVTYTFYFLDAIRDLNENNPIENFQYVFSTGPTLDSLSVTGTIYDALSLDPGEEIFVMLYSSNADTLPTTTIPEYITRANERGGFRIDNIAGGTYSVYGLKDLNGNKFYDLEDETFAFIDSTLSLSGANNFIPTMPDTLKTAADSARYLKIPGKEYELFLFTSDKKDQYLKSTERKEAYKLRYMFNIPVDSGQFSVEFPDFEQINYLQEESSGHDTLTIWILDSLASASNNLKVLTTYPETDSTGSISIIKDTIGFRFIPPRPARGRSAVKEPALKLSHNAAGRTGFKPGTNVWFSFDKPLNNIDTSLLRLYMVADTSRLRLDYTTERDTSYSSRVTMKHKFIEDSSYVLIWDKGAFTDIFGNTNDSSGVKIRVRNRETFGTLKMNLSGYSGNIILQLLSVDESMIREDKITLPDDNEILYPLLNSGEYMIKAIFDLNGDGKWTTGDYKSKRQPEPVTYYPLHIEIKVQWDLEQDWEISLIQEKSNSLRNH